MGLGKIFKREIQPPTNSGDHQVPPTTISELTPQQLQLVIDRSIYPEVIAAAQAELAKRSLETPNSK